MSSIELLPKGKTQPLSKEYSEVLIRICLLEMQKASEPPEVEYPFLTQIVKRRVDVMNLPIKFTPWGYVMIGAFAHNSGQAVLLLIDLLQRFEGKTIDTDLLCREAYPFGFYTKEQIEDYIDNYLKPRKVKWSEIY